MNDSADSQNLPAQIADAILSIPKGLIPDAVKAVDRLVGAATDIPVAWLAQQRAKIEAQTEAYKLVEGAIATAAAREAGADTDTIERAVAVLVRKEYRRQENRKSVAVAMLEDLDRGNEQTPAPDSGTRGEIEDDWLNVFERYAEDASSDRMQNLWGRVLAGEIRRPGKFSLRTLRFLSEFSQGDALSFETFCNSVIRDIAPKSLVVPKSQDVRELVYMEALGLIQGGTGPGLTRTLPFSERGYSTLREDDVCIIFKGAPKTTVDLPVVVLTPLGQELRTLLNTRDVRAIARRVAHAFRSEAIEEATIGVMVTESAATPQEVLWRKGDPKPMGVSDT